MKTLKRQFEKYNKNYRPDVRVSADPFGSFTKFRVENRYGMAFGLSELAMPVDLFFGNSEQ